MSTHEGAFEQTSLKYSSHRGSRMRRGICVDENNEPSTAMFIWFEVKSRTEAIAYPWKCAEFAIFKLQSVYLLK